MSDRIELPTLDDRKTTLVNVERDQRHGRGTWTVTVLVYNDDKEAQRRMIYSASITTTLAGNLKRNQQVE